MALQNLRNTGWESGNQMKETAVQINNRQIRNGIRKQREAIEREQQKVWDRLGDIDTRRKLKGEWTVEPATHFDTFIDPSLVDEITKVLIANINAAGFDE